MVIVEKYKTRTDGVELIRTYSDEGKVLVRNDGAIFSEAIDVKGIGYTYVEGNDYIEDDDATEEDYQQSLSEFGVVL